MPNLPEYPYAGRGYESTEDAPKFREDIAAMSDEAKRRRQAEANAALMLPAAMAEGDTMPSDVTVPQAYSMAGMEAKAASSQLRERARKMLEFADEVDRSGTGNTRAASTYRYVAAGLLKRAMALEAEQPAPAAVPMEEMPKLVQPSTVQPATPIAPMLSDLQGMRRG